MNSIRPASYYQTMIQRLSVLSMIFFLLATLVLGCEKHRDQAPLPPPIVEVEPVIQKDVPIYKIWVGVTDGFVNAKIRAQVEGYLISQEYKEGSYVKKGQIMFKIDPRPFKAALERAKATLAQAQAGYFTAKSDLEKILPLAKLNAVSKMDRDDAIGRAEAAKAAVEAAEAEVRAAEINLSFTNITSPIDGIAGIANAQIGDLVGTPGNPALTTVSTVDPIKVYIPISEQEYLYHVRRDDSKKQRGGSELQLILVDGTVFPHKGEFYFADRQVDEMTGTIKVAALFPNPGNVLRPGQFAKVRALIDVQKNALLVRQRAVMELQGSFQVAVVDSEGKAHIKSVAVGEKYGSFWVIKKGLQPGERVVVEGLQKIKEGIKVSPKPFQLESQGKPASGKNPSGNSGTKESNKKG